MKRAFKKIRRRSEEVLKMRKERKNLLNWITEHHTRKPRLPSIRHESQFNEAFLTFTKKKKKIRKQDKSAHNQSLVLSCALIGTRDDAN